MWSRSAAAVAALWLAAAHTHAAADEPAATNDLGEPLQPCIPDDTRRRGVDVVLRWEMTQSTEPRLIAMFNGTLPGPVIHANQGEWLEISVVNELGIPATVSWPGLRHPETGTLVRAHATAATTEPGQQAVYGLCASHPGTYIYEAHAKTLDASTAIGIIVVHPVEEPVDAWSTSTSDWQLFIHESLDLGSAVRMPTYYAEATEPQLYTDSVLINGAAPGALDLEAVAGTTTVARIVMGRVSTPMKVTVDGAQMVIVELDGATTEPTPVTWLSLHPSQRATVRITWPSTAETKAALRVVPASASTDVNEDEGFVTAIALAPAKEEHISAASLGLSAPSFNIPESATGNDVNALHIAPAASATSTAAKRKSISLRTHFHLSSRHQSTEAHQVSCSVHSQHRLFHHPNGGSFFNVKEHKATKTNGHSGSCMLAKTGEAKARGLRVENALPAGHPPVHHGSHKEEESTPSRDETMRYEHELPGGSLVEVTVTNNDDVHRPLSFLGAKAWIVSASDAADSTSQKEAQATDVTVDASIRLRDVIIAPARGWVKALLPVEADGLYDTRCHIVNASPFKALPLSVLEPVMLKPRRHAHAGKGRKLTAAPGQYMSYDGTGHSSINGIWNSVGSWFQPLDNPRYGDGISTLIRDPNPRNISNLVANMAPFRYNNFGVAAYTAAWGQFLAHDVIMTGTVEHHPAPGDNTYIAIPAGDLDLDPEQLGNRVLGFDRNEYDRNTGNGTVPRRQINSQSGWVDASTVYGVSAGRCDILRAFFSGFMLADPNNGVPVNRHCINMAAPGRSPCIERLGGDVRANVAPGILTLHGLFILEHNWWARKLATQNPTWDDETLFQESRKRVIAEIQAISMNSYTASVLGDALPPYRGFNASADPRINPMFAIAAYRYGHSGIDSEYWCIKADGKQCPQGHLLLRENFFNPRYFDWGITIADLIRGMSVQLESNIDSALVPDVRSHLFGLHDDLASQDIMRGRDFGLPSFTEARRIYGLSVPTRFSQISSDPRVARALSIAYNGDVNAVDLWVGGLAESGGSGKFVGPTFAAIIKDQMIRLRDGDWYWYENKENTYTLEDGTVKRYFEDSEISAISATTLGTIIARVTDWTDAVPNPFRTTGVIALGGAIAGASSASAGAASSTTSTTSSAAAATTPTSTASTATAASPSPAAASASAAAPSSSASASASQAQTVTVARVAVNSYVTLEWTPPAASATDITITVSFNGDGWLGMGLGTAGMIGADVIFMKRSSAALGGEVTDAKATGYMLPGTDARQDVTLLSVTRTGTRTAFQIKRNLNTGDSNDYTIGAGSVPMVFAWDTSSNTIGYHGSNRISTSVNFLSPPASALVTLTVGGNDTGGGGIVAGDIDADELVRQGLIASYGWHGISMFFVWAVLVPAGCMAAHFLKHRPGHQAFHKWTMLTARMGATITVPAAGGALIQSTQQAVNLVHLKLGMVIAASLLGEVLFGSVVRSWVSSNKVPPPYWMTVKRFHNFLGWIMFLAGLGNCILGAQLILKYGQQIMVVYDGIMICLAATVIGYKCFCRRKAGVNEVGDDQGRRMAMSQSRFSLSMAELRANVRSGSQWVIVGGYIYDISGFTKHHPGGAYLLAKCIGNDVTQLFYGRETADRNVPAYLHSELAYKLLRTMCIAALKSSVDVRSWADAPSLDDRECTDQWKVVKRTIVCPDSRRPVFKIELIHPSANAVAAADWNPQSFGRHMIARGTPAQIRAVAERELREAAGGGPSRSGLSRISRRASDSRIDDRGQDIPIPVADAEALIDHNAVERPYTIVRPDNKPGLIMYIRRYPKGGLSPYVTGVREGELLTLSGPKGLGMHLDNYHSGVLVGIYQGTCVCAAFDLLQYIVATAAERAEAGKVMATGRGMAGKITGRERADDSQHPAALAAAVKSQPREAWTTEPSANRWPVADSAANRSKGGSVDDGARPRSRGPPVVASVDKHGNYNMVAAPSDVEVVPERPKRLFRAASYKDAIQAPDMRAQIKTLSIPTDPTALVGKSARARAAGSNDKPHLKLVLFVVAENEEGIVEREWLRYLDETCPDFELHCNIMRVRNPATLEGMPRVYTGRITPMRLDGLLPPTDLLTVSVCGTPQFQTTIADMYTDMGLPRSLLTIVS